MVFIINMRVFKTVLLLSMLSSLVSAGPASFLRLEHRTSDDDGPSLPLDSLEVSEPSSTIPPIKEDTYDQRQNGTENYRIHVDGLVLVVAPIEGLLLAGGLPGGSNDLFPALASAVADKPEPKPEEMKPTSKPDDEKLLETLKPENSVKKSMQRPHMRLMSLLAPFLRRIAPQ